MIEEAWGSEQYVSESFKDHYSYGARFVESPPKIEQREFGFLSFGGNVMYRHIRFKDANKLENYLMRYAPAHAYFSAAYYRNPDVPMKEKEWLGADLVFDIDADHFDLLCQETHDRWKCKICGTEGKGHPPHKCAKCGKVSFIVENWLCENCLNAAKYEAQKLLDILVQDFGFDPSIDLSVNFSGNRGYHVHVRSPYAVGLDQPSRREIVDYVLGTGIQADYQGIKRKVVDDGSLSVQWGWRERSMKALYDFISTMNIDQLRDLKVSKKNSNKLIKNQEKILDILMLGEPSRISNIIDSNTLGKLLEVAVEKQASAIDTVVTTDLRRLIRLPNTLHGKTGWLTQKISIEDLSDYDPLTMAIAFREGTEKVYIKHAPKISLMGETYGPFKEEAQELPLSVVMFLLCRKAARVVR
jgi:DNA primase small subunit